MSKHLFNGTDAMPEQAHSIIGAVNSGYRLVLHALAETGQTYPRAGIENLVSRANSGNDFEHDGSALVTSLARVAVGLGTWRSQTRLGGFSIGGDEYLDHSPFVAAQLGVIAAQYEIDPKTLVGENHLRTKGRISPVEVMWRFWSAFESNRLDDNQPFNGSGMAKAIGTTVHTTSRILLSLKRHEVVAEDPNAKPTRQSFATYTPTDRLFEQDKWNDFITANPTLTLCASMIAASNVELIVVPELAMRLGTPHRDSQTRVADRLELLADGGLLAVVEPGEEKVFSHILTEKGEILTSKMVELYEMATDNDKAKETGAEALAALRLNTGTTAKILKLGHGDNTRHDTVQASTIKLVLDAVTGNPGITSTDITLATRYKRNAVSDALQHLQTAGLVRKQKKGNQNTWNAV